VTAALIFEDEVRSSVPHDEWDVPVVAAITPSGWMELGGNPGFASWR
jgi:5-formyltetrahydrofolate cyclo-ligase